MKTDLESVKSILERGPAVVYRCREFWDYALDYISPNIVHLLGWEDEDFRENPLLRLQLIHPDDMQGVVRKVSNLMDEGVQLLEYRMLRKDGNYIWVLDDVRCIQNEAGEFDGVIGYLSDISVIKSAQSALEASEMRHRAIFNTVLEGIITIDSQGLIQDMNPAAENIFGYLKEEVAGKNVSMLMPEPYASHHDMYLQKYRESREAQIIGIGRDVKGLRKTGDVFDMRLSVSSLKLPQGEFFVGCVNDISGRVQAERELKTSQDRLKLSQKFAHIGTWDWDFEADVIYWSEEVAPILGLDGKYTKVPREKMKKWIHPDDIGLIREKLDTCLKNGGEYDSQHRIIWGDGTVKWVHEQGNLYYDEHGKCTRMLGVIRDVSQAKAHEADLFQAREEAVRANQAKSEFLSNMSHELRTPLNAILGFAQLLGMSRKHPLEERQIQQVDQIVRAGGHLLELINEVLDLARIETGRLSLSIEQVVMEDIVEECIELTESLAGKKGVGVSVSQIPLVALWGDRKRIKQILLNLLSNAVKYNNVGGHVHLDIKADEPGFVCFSIIDDGPGIKREKFNEIFKPFSRLGAEMGEVEGTGIGLVLTKQLVEAMNGKIGFESEQDKGSTFWFKIPVGQQDVSNEDDEAPLMVGNVSQTVSVLYVEDNGENRDVMKQFASMTPNLDLHLANNAEEGLQLLKKTSPDAIMVDIHMDGMGGLNMVEILRKLPEYKTFPIWALSADATEPNRERAFAAGCSEFFTKPLNLKEFSDKLNLISRERE